MANVGNTWTIVRVKDISGGFVPDDDWELTQDFAGWEAATPHWHVTDRGLVGAGTLELMVSFYDDPSNSIPSLGNSRVDVQSIERLHVDGVPDRLVDVGSERQIPGDVVLQAPDLLMFQSLIAYRFTSAQSLPNAHFVAVLAQLA